MRAGLARSLRAGVLAFLLVSPLQGAEPAQRISWWTRFEQARAEAKRQNRPLWIQFTGSWCLFCRKMEHETLARPEVIRQARDHFVPVLVPADDREDLVAHFGVSGLPATVVVHPSGAVVARHEGFAEPQAFVAFLTSSRSLPKSASTEPALGGYCPVSLVQGNGLQPGRSDLVLRHDGRDYRFANVPLRDAFLRDPERYIPSNGGQCAVNRIERALEVPGRPQHAVYYRGRLYLCSDEPARQRFARDPERYANADLAEGGYCAHCRDVAGRSVPGLPQYAVTHEGKRYLFPAREHLEAFRAEPDRYVR
jgi:YHS domain-containing protein/thioredoxin-related protein